MPESREFIKRAAAALDEVMARPFVSTHGVHGENKANAKQPLDRTALENLAKAIVASIDEEGRANLARVGGFLAKQAPDFHARDYGFARLSEMLIASGLVDVESSRNNPNTVTVKLKASNAMK